LYRHGRLLSSLSALLESVSLHHSYFPGLKKTKPRRDPMPPRRVH